MIPTVMLGRMCAVRRISVDGNQSAADQEGGEERPVLPERTELCAMASRWTKKRCHGACALLLVENVGSADPITSPSLPAGGSPAPRGAET